MPPSLANHTVRLGPIEPLNPGCSTITCWSACAELGADCQLLICVNVVPLLVLFQRSMPPTISVPALVGSTHSALPYQPWLDAGAPR